MNHVDYACAVHRVTRKSRLLDVAMATIIGAALAILIFYSI